MENDDNIRSETGLAVCLRDMGNGKSRIFIDDVMADNKQNPINWSYNCFYTFSPELDNQSLNEMNISEKQFQDIGAAVLARLLALNGRI